MDGLGGVDTKISQDMPRFDTELVQLATYNDDSATASTRGGWGIEEQGLGQWRFEVWV